MFDDPAEEMQFDLKKTSTKRYEQEYEHLELNRETKIENWQAIIKSPANKRRLNKPSFCSGSCDEIHATTKLQKHI